MDQSTERKGIKRRTLVAGTAWAVPAVTIAAPARAFTGSNANVTAVGDAYKLPGNSCGYPNDNKQAYRYYFDVTNPPGCVALVKFTDFKVGGTSLGVTKVFVEAGDNPCTSCCPTVTNAVCVPAGRTVTVAVDTRSDSSSQTSAQVFYEVYSCGSTGDPCNSPFNNCASPAFGGSADAAPRVCNWSPLGRDCQTAVFPQPLPSQCVGA